MPNSLVVAIVEADDGKRAVDQLVRLGFTATTIRLGTRFLDAGDSIVLVGCEDTTKCIIEDHHPPHLLSKDSSLHSVVYRSHTANAHRSDTE